jgi:hypothetical protein
MALVAFLLGIPNPEIWNCGTRQRMVATWRHISTDLSLDERIGDFA